MEEKKKKGKSKIYIKKDSGDSVLNAQSFNTAMGEHLEIYEDGLSRILQHTEDKNTFAVIGSEDKDTKKDRSQELLREVSELSRKLRDKRKIGFKHLQGTYTCEDGTLASERSLIIYNITKEEALRIARKLNQESIIWKDENFFGFLDMNGNADGELGRGINLDNEKVLYYGNKLLGKHNKAKGFVFEALEYSFTGSTFSRQNKGEMKHIKILSIGFNEGYSKTPICYIECPPKSRNIGHIRYASGNINCIYNETLENLDTYKDCELRELTEANLKRVSRGHDKDGYIIISASREELSAEENNRRTKNLKELLRKNHYSYLPVYGGYKELGQDKASMEKSFVVYPYDIVHNTTVDFNTFKNDMIKFSKDESVTVRDKSNSELNQDSILVCEPGGKPHYLALKPGVEEMEFDSVEYNDTDKEYFTAIKKWNDSSLNRRGHDWDKGSPQRFTLTMDEGKSILQETSTSRILQHIQEDKNWAIISPYRSEYSEEENRKRMAQLKFSVRKYGFIEFISRWVEYGESFDERSLLIPNISREEAIKLGKKFEQSSVIIYDNSECLEICTTPFEDYAEGDVVRKYNISGDAILNIHDAEEIFAKRRGGPASKPVKGGKAFHLSEVYEVEQPRASYFQSKETLHKIL